MSNLKEILRDLKKSYIFNLTFEGELYHPKLLEKAAEKIQLVCSKGDRRSPNFDYDALYDKVTRLQKGFLIYNGKSQFTYREIINLPLILYNKNSSVELEQFIITNFNMLPKINTKVLSREIRTYVVHFDREATTKLLRQDILSKLQSTSFASKRLQTWSQNLYIFDEKANFILGEKLAKIALSDLMQQLCFDNTLLTSRLIVYSLMHFFKEQSVSVQDKMIRFREIKALNCYTNGILGNFANYLIPAVNKDGDIQNIEELRNFFFEKFGDSRYSLNLVHWHTVQEPVREIFKNWLARYDINLFFEIISDTVLDQTSANKMWRYRQAFWLAYLPYIKNTWVLFGDRASIEARHLRKDQIFNFGKLIGGGSNRSAILFQIGNFVFIEQSHNGKLRIWQQGDCPVEFGKKSIEYSKIPDSLTYIEEFVHASPSTYNWQTKVRLWIGKHCGYYTNQRDWEV